MLNNILEISKRVNKGGRVPIKIALLKIHDDERETNTNGIHWCEEFVKNRMDSAKSMPICAEFDSADSKEVPISHGLTGFIVNENGIREPVFENSETVGVIENVEITTISIDGEDVKVLLGTGYLFNQRYPLFVKWVRKNVALGHVDSSIEIMGYESNNNSIVYKEDEPTEEYRTPMDFDFTGTAILSVKPADENAIVVEISQKNKEENLEMTEQEILEVVQKAISETNSVKEDVDAKIAELNTQISEKDNTISELNASVAQLQTALDALKAEHETYWAERELLENELVKAKVATKLGELDSVVGEFNDAETEQVKDEIEELKKNINSCEKPDQLESFTSEINSLKAKICTAIVEKQKQAEAEAKIAEQNSANDTVTIDIFSEINSDETDDSEDTNIF